MTQAVDSKHAEEMDGVLVLVLLLLLLLLLAADCCCATAQCLSPLLPRLLIRLWQVANGRSVVLNHCCRRATWGAEAATEVAAHFWPPCVLFLRQPCSSCLASGVCQYICDEPCRSCIGPSQTEFVLSPMPPPSSWCLVTSP